MKEPKENLNDIVRELTKMPSENHVDDRHHRMCKELTSMLRKTRDGIRIYPRRQLDNYEVLAREFGTKTFWRVWMNPQDGTVCGKALNEDGTREAWNEYCDRQKRLSEAKTPF